MALPTSQPETAESAFRRVLSTAQIVSSALRAMRDLIASGEPVYTDNLVALYRNLNSSKHVGETLQSVPGLTEYARSATATGNPNYDIQAEFGMSVRAGAAITEWLITNLPSDGNGGYVGWELRDDGTMDRRAIPISELVPLQGLIVTALTTFA